LNRNIYSFTVGIILFIHLVMQNTNLNSAVQVTLSAIIAIIMLILFNRIIRYDMSQLDKYVNGLFFVIQFAVLLLYFNVTHTWILIILFIMIEFLRNLIVQKITKINTQVTNYEKEHDQMNETFKRIRSERHDFLKHISAIHFMLEKKQYNEVKTYLDELVGTYEETNMSIKGEKGVVAGILNNSYRKATKLGISTDYNLDIPISSLPMKDQEIVALIGNLLSNSIEASEEWQNQRGKQAYLALEFAKRSGLFILICKNNSMPIPTYILDKLYQSFGHSTKEGGEQRGFGTKIINDIVQKYEGYLDFTYKNEQFTVKIKLPALIE